MDLLFGLGIDPDTLSRLALYLCHLLDEAVDVLSLPPRVGTDVDRIDVLPVQQMAHGLILLLHTGDDLVQEVIRQKRKRIQAPALVLRIVYLRIAHGHEMAHAPGHDVGVGLDKSVAAPHSFSERFCKFLRDARLLCDKQCFCHIFLPGG